MPTIQVKLILRPRKQRCCHSCGAWMGGPQLRLFGNADAADPPYAMYVCPDVKCAGSEPAVMAVLAAHQEELQTPGWSLSLAAGR